MKRYLLNIVLLAYVLVLVGGITVFASPSESSYFSGNLETINGYQEYDLTILTRAVVGDEVRDTIKSASEHFLDFEGGKDYNYYGILICEPAEDGYYKVIDKNFTIGRPEGGIKWETQIPEDGVLLGIHGGTQPAFTLIEEGSRIGDYIKFDSIDLKEIERSKAGNVKATSVFFELFHDANESEATQAPVSTNEPEEGIEKKAFPLYGIIIGLVGLVVVIVIIVVLVLKKKK